MATKSMAYDHPAYTAVLPISGTLTGASKEFGFAAFTAMLVKSVSMKALTAGTTSNDIMTVLVRSAASGTLTTVLCTYGSAAVNGTNIASALSSYTLAQGDAISILKAADATDVYAVTFETVVAPASTVTA